MIRSVRPLVTAAIVAGVTAALMAQTPTQTRTPPKTSSAITPPAVVPALALTPGLWQMTSTASMDIDTSKMPAAQAAQVQAAMKQMAASRPSQTKQVCVTKDSLAKDVFGADTQDAQCTMSFNKNTSTILDAEQTCTGDQPSHVTAHFEATSATSVSGTVHASASANGATTSTDVTISGKYLAADCGKVK